METVKAKDNIDATVIRRGGISEGLCPRGVYNVQCFDVHGKLKWDDRIENLVVIQGKNHALDNYLAGAAYTASFFYGLISSVSYTVIAAGDTAAQINGTNQWKEAGPTNAPNYTSATRPAATFGAAATGGSKTASVAASFILSGAGTVKGAFLSTSSVKEGTSGALISAGTFSGGDKVLGIGDEIKVSYTLVL